MSAKATDTERIKELYKAIKETEDRVALLCLNEDDFLDNDTIQNRIAADSLLMCVFRVCEEAGNVSEELASSYPNIEWRAIRGMRNIIAHDYGSVDKEIIWTAIIRDLPILKSMCVDYSSKLNMKL